MVRDEENEKSGRKKDVEGENRSEGLLTIGIGGRQRNGSSGSEDTAPIGVFTVQGSFDECRGGDAGCDGVCIAVCWSTLLDPIQIFLKQDDKHRMNE